jgi:hypothetical protein
MGWSEKYWDDVKSELAQPVAEVQRASEEETLEQLAHAAARCDTAHVPDGASDLSLPSASASSAF